MKKNKLKEFFSKPGFYVALFTSTAVIVAITIGLTMNNWDIYNKNSKDSPKDLQSLIAPKESEEYETIPVDKSNQKELLSSTAIPNVTVTQPLKTTQASKPTTNNTTNTTNATNNKPIEQINLTEEKTNNSIAVNTPVVNEPVPKAEEKVETSKTNDTSQAVENNTAIVTENVTSESDNEIAIETANEISDEAANKTSDETTNDAVATFASFSDDQKMSWPLVGEIVMDYAVDRVIYDKTLDQYRTNPSICIGANVGTQVKAAADGIVIDVLESREKGTKVVIDHGNGWNTTYAQLQPNILVEIGEVVKAGDVIGGVANPTLYGILLGGHLDFLVSKNDVTYDPKAVLE